MLICLPNKSVQQKQRRKARRTVSAEWVASDDLQSWMALQRRESADCLVPMTMQRIVGHNSFFLGATKHLYKRVNKKA